MRNAGRRFRRISESPEWRRTHEDVQSVGNRVAEVGLEYFCLDYVSKNGVSVTERNRYACRKEIDGTPGSRWHIHCRETDSRHMGRQCHALIWGLDPELGFGFGFGF